MKIEKREVEFISMGEDGVFKTLWLLGDDKVKQKLKNMMSYALGYDISEYENIGVELGKVTYDSIFNKTDVLLLNKRNKKLLNVELNRFDKNNYNNKNNSYLYKIAGEYYNYVGMKSRDNYKIPIDAEQLNINCFKCPEDPNIIKSTFQMVDTVNNLVDGSVTKTNIYIDKDSEKCYDNDNLKDFLMFRCESYEEMEKLAEGDEGRMSIMENLKRLGGDIAFTDHINTTKDKIILDAQNREEEMKAAIRKAKREAKKEARQEVREEVLAEGREKGLAEGREKGLVEGREKGLAEGREKGRIEEKNNLIFSMHKKGLTVEQIADIVDTTVTEVNTIIKRAE